MTPDEIYPERYSLEFSYLEIAAIVSALHAQLTAYADPKIRKTMVLQMGGDWEYAEMSNQYMMRVLAKLEKFRKAD